MQIFFFLCLFVVALICLIQGLRKSSFNRTDDFKQHCAICGWTSEKVQLCRFEQHHKAMVAPLCFDCTIKHDALLLRAGSVDGIHVAHV